jgi:predicted transcriptional regulator
MIELKRQKGSPDNHSYQWTKNDRKTLKTMLKEGKSMKEIAEALGRTPAAVQYQKSAMGLVTKKVKEKKVKMKTKEGKKIEVKVSAEAISNTEMSPRDKAKEMASVARGIARSNGKRITMAMFFVEDL